MLEETAQAYSLLSLAANVQVFRKVHTTALKWSSFDSSPFEVSFVTTEGVPRPLNWKELYGQAMLEMDPGKLPSAITRANEAILDRIERIDRNSLGHELSALNYALNNLRLLRREYERGMKEYRQQDQRKLG